VFRTPTPRGEYCYPLGMWTATPILHYRIKY
jgi:hypothetical protein